MGEQRNLTPENVEEARALFEKMQETNPDLEFEFFRQFKGPQDARNDDELGLLEDQIDKAYTELLRLQDIHIKLTGRSRIARRR